MSVENNYKIKTLLIGDSGVGKSSIMNQFVEEKYTESYQCTIGVDYKTIHVNIYDKSIKFLIWDTAGQERFKSITRIYYRGAMIIFYVFDITDRISFENIPNWIKETNNIVSDSCIKVLIGNKCDYDYDYNYNHNEIKRKVSFIEANEFSKSNGFINYYETSAKKNINIEKCFLDIGEYYMKNIQNIQNTKNKSDNKSGNKSDNKSIKLNSLNISKELPSNLSEFKIFGSKCFC